MDSKYFYISHVQFQHSSNNRQPEIVKWNKAHYVEMYENVEWWPYISLSIVKYKSDSYPKPKSGKYQSVKPIIEDLFDDYYNHALRNIFSNNLCETEFYLIEKSKNWFQLEYYSEDVKDKRNVSIDFRNSIEELWLIVDSNHVHRSRPNARKNGKPIKQEDFLLFLNLTLRFLSDHNSYEVYLDTYIKDFLKLVSGDKKIESFYLSADKAFKDILDTLDKRKSKIEKRLIENDQDTQEDRIKLRGELEGLNYAIKTVHINK